jgi:beta-fructofuranosidase
MFALVGKFEDDTFLPDTSQLQLLDFGTDFYAMQSFRADGRQIAFAWLFNWEDRKPAGSPYSGEMSLPRELQLDAGGRLLMRPVSELDAACLTFPVAIDRNAGVALDDVPLDLRLTGSLEGTRISATQGGQLSFEIAVSGGRVSVRLLQDDGSIRYDAPCASVTDLRVVYDRGIIEIFADNGAICGTRRNYSNVSPDSLGVTSQAQIALFERRVANQGEK